MLRKEGRYYDETLNNSILRYAIFTFQDDTQDVILALCDDELWADTEVGLKLR